MSGSHTPPHRHKGVHLALGILVSAACLWWAARDILKEKDALSKLGGAFADANYITAIPILLAWVAFYWLKAWRWRLLLRPVGDYRIRRDLLPPTMIGFAFNNLLPAHLGDLVRVFIFSRQSKAPQTAVLSTVVLERVFDIVAILLILGVGLIFVHGLDPSIRQSAVVFGVAAGCCVLGGLAFVLWTRPFVRLFEAAMEWIPFLPAGLKKKIAGMLESGAEGLASLKDVRLLAGILATSQAQWLLNGLTVHLALWSFGIHVDPLVSCIVLGVTAFGVTVPSSPGYFGVIQLCFMAVLKFFTKDETAVFAASIYYHMIQYIPVTLIGLWYFNTTGLKIADVEATVENQSADVVVEAPPA